MQDKVFFFHTILPREEICNYTKVQSDLLTSMLNGERRVLFGRRNIGKTSLVQNAIVPDFCAKLKNNTFVLFVDFYGVKSLEHIRDRVVEAFQRAFSATFPKRALFAAATTYLKGLRPVVSADPMTGEAGISIESVHSNTAVTLEQIFEKISELSKSHSCLLVFDEFQDIHFIPQAEAKLRRLFENLPPRMPILVFGSKQHLLSEIFAKPRAPFASWGLPYEIPKISKEDYHAYINMRFKSQRLKIELAATEYLLIRLQNVPEAINIVCDEITRLRPEKMKTIANDDIEIAIEQVTRNSASLFRTLVATLSIGEEDVLRGIAKMQPVASVRSKDFLSKSKLSSTGASKALKRLLDAGHVLQDNEGFWAADPLLREFLCRNV